jgi:hypothetical protein
VKHIIVIFSFDFGPILSLKSLMLAYAGAASLCANPSSIMIQKILWIWEAVFLAAEVSTQVLEHLREACLLILVKNIQLLLSEFLAKIISFCCFSLLVMLLLSDVSTTMIIQPGPVVDFLIANQNVRDPFSLDWAKVTHVSACFFLCFSSFLHF